MPQLLHFISRKNYVRSRNTSGLFTITFATLVLITFSNAVAAQTQAVSLEQFVSAQHDAHPEITGLLPVEKLIYEVQPIIYAENGSVTIFGTQPVCLQTTAQQAASVPALGLPVEDVELLTVKIKSQSDLASPLNLAAFSDFTSLRYIHILFEVHAPASALSSYIVNAPAGASVFYSTQLNN